MTIEIYSFKFNLIGTSIVCVNLCVCWVGGNSSNASGVKNYLIHIVKSLQFGRASSHLNYAKADLEHDAAMWLTRSSQIVQPMLPWKTDVKIR